MVDNIMRFRKRVKECLSLKKCVLNLMLLVKIANLYIY